MSVRAQLVILSVCEYDSDVCHSVILIPKVTFIFHIVTLGKYPIIVPLRG